MKDEEESFISSLSLFHSNAFKDLWPVWLTLALLTTLPYVIAAIRTPAGLVFTGVLTAYDDTFTYFAWMRQGADGHFLMCDLFTSESQSCEFFLPLWTILGLIVRITRLPIWLTFHAARLLSGLLLLVVARSVIGMVINERSRARYTLWLYAMSGGFGWLIYAIRNRSDLFGAASSTGAVDMNMPEALAFRSVFGQVHFAVGAVLVFASIRLLFLGAVEKRKRDSFIAGILTSALAVVHPYLIVVVCAVAGITLLSRPFLHTTKDKMSGTYISAAGGGAMFGAGLLPGVTYLIYLNRSNEVLREWFRITDTMSPPPWEYVLGFGLVAALAVPGSVLMWKGGNSYSRLVLLWAVVHMALLYAPLTFQRRLVEGLQLPLSIAAAIALFWIADRMPKRPVTARYRTLLLTGAVVFSSLTNLGFIVGQTIARGNASASSDPRRYLTRDLTAAFDWLRDNSDSGAVLFSSYITGNVAPCWTGRRVFLGHYGQTIHSDEKGVQVTAFYAGSLSDDTARRLFAEHRIRFAIYGGFERRISGEFVPPSWLKPAFQSGEVRVFEVTDENR